ncbi:hypothetical protein [Burkholderia pseudomultivorans]|uniref:Lipoprotein transmembrane n=1 Tax=Burkholderia pseudomultivorans TaxID=1207504 RepID=A0ABU2DZE6_9BURK|nr:hypothetical protein [Burkholderia pseudomultivorans]MDR8732224.1 hypothetical protein [Burkholderia pseudomultivorans]MDR8736004.1 hypothetical protein [Burkholderia pseudomultivorans]MDR8741980.1 hypothetical protein [Burkholderia pseudomultivorans]MDR8752794.1 hypothetical protein [Burkholderia pseudomultivorans]MDR8778574.1 hypothetical protein [Burkholderia pseudomultivorans]
MQHAGEKHRIVQVAAATFAVAAALGLSACGGGDDGGSPAASIDASAGGATSGGASSSSSSIRVEGESHALSSSFAEVNVLTPPVSWNADGSFPSGSLVLSARSVDASLLKSQAPGAYTVLPRSKDTLSLSTGTVTDIAGNGDFAIGRWTAGSDSAGHSYNANQGQTWAVGAPVTVGLTDQSRLNCSLVAATRPTSTDGNTAPGSLGTATAVVTGQTDAFGQRYASAALTLQYSIGTDKDQTFSGNARVGAMVTSSGTRSSLYSSFMGPNAATPYLVVSYGVYAPTAGGINGLAMLSCK